MARNTTTIFDGTGDSIPSGLPSDPRTSYNPSRMSFSEVNEGSQSDGSSSFGDAADPDRTHVSDSESEVDSVRRYPERTYGFELRTVIGKGGFGEVWEGVQHSLNRVIAIKRVRDDIYEKARDQSRSSSYCELGFRHEALTTGALDHPNIVPVYDFGEDERGRPILAMKLVRGKPWDQIMWDDYNDPTQEFLAKHLQIFISVAQAVAFAHSRGVVHRDIKPAQVMVGEFGEVVLMDWGLAIVYDKELTQAHESPLKSGVIPTCDSAPNPAGTIAFMAPEQTLNNSLLIGPHTDVYLLAGSLYFLLTRTPPHAAPDSKAAFIEARSGEVDIPKDRCPERDIPDELAGLCMRALEPDISKRLQKASDLIDGVKAYLTGAGKRRDSEALVEEARSLVENDECSYRDLAGGLSAIERAAGLWPENPDISELRELYHVRFARLALRNRDLVLASAQADRITDDKIRKGLSLEINRRRVTISRLRWTVRIFMGGTVVLLIVVSLMAQGLNRRAAEASRLRDAAESGERAAVSSRRNAEELVNFLVEDLYNSLERLGRLDLIDRVAIEANQYYANLPTEGSSDQLSESLRRARALRVLGDVQAQDRTRILDEPYAAYSESLRISEELLARHPNRIDVNRSLAASQYRFGNILIWMGDPERGLQQLQTSEKLNKEVHAREPHRTDALLEAARSILLRAEVLGYLGQPEFGEPLMRDAVELFGVLEGSESTRPEARRHRARAWVRWADELAHLGRMEEASEVLLRARGDLELLARDNSYELHRRVELARVSSLEAFIEFQQGSLEVANEANRAAIAEMEQVIEFSLSSIEWQRHLVEAYIVQAHIDSERGDLDAAVEWASRAVVISRGTAFQDPANILSQTWLAITYGIVGTLMQDYGHSRIALEELDTAMSILESLIRQSTSVTYWKEKRAAYAIVRARALYDLGAADEAANQMALLEDEWLQSDRVDRPEVQLILADARLVLGFCLSKLGREEEAWVKWEQASEGARKLIVNEAPNRYLAQRTKAAALLMLGRTGEAREVIRALRERGFVGRELEKVIADQE